MNKRRLLFQQASRRTHVLVGYEIFVVDCHLMKQIKRHSNGVIDVYPWLD